MERRVLKLEVLERRAGAVRFKIAEQSHRGYTNFAPNGDGFKHNGVGIESHCYPDICDWRPLIVLKARGDDEDKDDDELFCSEEIYDNKIVPAVQAYNDTNGGFGFADVCPTCGQEIKDWKPKKKETYFFFDEATLVGSISNRGTLSDMGRIKNGNAFATRELAEIAAEKVKEVLKNCKHS